MAITFALYDFKQRMQLVFMIIIVIDIVGHIIKQKPTHKWSRLGAYASTKLNYKLLSKLIIHFFFLVENERKAKTV